MKLKNKKTGEVFDALIRERGGGDTYSIIVCDIKSYNQSKSTLLATHPILDEYNSLAELNEEWKDYKPAEPLIKDEKIRKAVRAWAEANEITNIYCYQYKRTCEFDCDRTDLDCYASIRFIGDDIIDKRHDNAAYTIAELCGEEEQ